MTCTAASCLSTAAVLWIFGIPMGCWALGFGIGQSILWVRRLVDAA